MSVDKKAFVGGLAVAVAVVMVISVVAGEPAIFDDRTGGSVLRNLIYDFQTLITGVFALFAAWWTIAKMQESDRLQEERHWREMETLQRPHLLAAERLLSSVPGWLRSSAAHMKLLDVYIPDRDAEPEWTAKIHEVMGYAAMNFHWTIRVLSSNLIDDARPYFDAQLNERLWYVELLLHVFTSRLKVEDITVTGEDGVRPSWVDDGSWAVFADSAIPLEELADQIERWGKAFIERNS
ncbi:hypothetical protein U8C32_17040 [Sinorhizobium medicae]|uniref:hypothetical protein n=1 Tax=Sinorhizobium medicae TaxID=110321 RepID=UPI002AF6A395|nr:hypothetical protein [Sinorhizobium medicae]WQO91470.1 hypothetical protein U8C32_17040 [Sinorhizobium medicae]